MKWLIVVLAFSSAAFTQQQCGEHDAKSSDGLRAVENRWVVALDTGDQKQLACILAPEFKDIGVYGELRDRDRVLADLPNRKAAGQHLDGLETLILESTGIVRGVNHLTTSEGKSLVNVRFTDVFVYREGRWQAVSAQESLVRPLQKQ